MAGFAGAYFTLGSVGRFDEVMTAGRGFISLAAMIFGNWMPFGSFGAGLLFGFADSLASKLAILGVDIPSQFLLMAPYCDHDRAGGSGWARADAGRRRHALRERIAKLLSDDCEFIRHPPRTRWGGCLVHAGEWRRNEGQLFCHPEACPE